MISTKFLRFACILFAGMAFFSCSDDSGNAGGSGAGKTEDGHDVRVFQKGSLDDILVRTDTTVVTDSSFEGTVIFQNMKPEEIPSVGDVIVSGITKNAEYGFLYKVLGVSTNNGITAVVVRGASLEEAIDNVDFHEEIVMEFNENDEVVGIRQKSVGGPVGVSFTTPEIEVKGKYPFENEKKEEVGSLSANVKYTMTYNIEMNIERHRVKSTKISVSPKGELGIKGEIKGEFKPKKPLQNYAYSKILDAIEFPIPIPVPPFAIPVVIFNAVDVLLQIEAEAEIGLELSTGLEGSGEYGFRYTQDSGFKPIYETQFSPVFDFEQSVGGYARASVLVGLSSLFYNRGGVRLAAGPAFQFSAKASPIGIFVYDEGFGKDYEKYQSIWGEGWREGVESEEDNGIFINNILLANESKYNANALRYIDNEVRAELGAEISFQTELRVIGKRLVFELGNTFFPLKTLYRTSFLPFIGEVGVSRTATGINVRSVIERDFLNYPIRTYGFCIGKSKDACELGGDAIKRYWIGPVGIGKRKTFDVDFYDYELEDTTYYIRPYFENYMGGTYYDKAYTYKYRLSDPITPSSSSIASSSSSLDVSDPIVSSCSLNGETVKIGDQVWMKENLNCNISGSRCRFNNASNCAIFGRLYDWATAMNLPSSCNSSSCSSQIKKNRQGICPSGWHVPSVADWGVLMKFINPSCLDHSSCADAGTKLKSASLWKSSSNVPVGTDEFGFSALPGGDGALLVRDTVSYTFGSWWTSDDGSQQRAEYRTMSYDNENVSISAGDKELPRSVRCIQD